jgi:HEAT repeat protein
MNAVTEQTQKNISILRSSQPEPKIELLEALAYSEIDESLIEVISEQISDDDKGVRNSASMLILNNRNENYPKHIIKYVSSTNISVRNLAGEILIKLGPISVDAIIKFNHENDDDILKFIIDVLGLIGDERASSFIMEILSATENDNVVLACIEALGNIRFGSSVEVMMLLYDRNELYKPTVVEALGKIGSKAALDFLVSRYTTEDELTKYSILESLGNLGDIDTYFFLLEQVRDANGPLVWPLIASISVLKEKYNLDIPFDNKMKNLLMSTITEGSPEHKKVAFSLIDSFDDKDILCASLNMVGEDYELDEMISSKMFRNVEYIYHDISRIINQNPPNLKNILNLFINAINYVAEYQIQLNISMLEIRNIIHAITGLLNHFDEEVRRSAMEIIFNMDADSALLFIDTMVSDENTWNRLRLLELLENMQGEKFNSSIAKLINDDDEMVRERALLIASTRNINQISTNAN